MDFFNKDNYTIDDIRYLITNTVEESIHLDYKASGALDKSDQKKKIEISKDIASFANSDGGIIIYGVEEKDNKPIGFSYIDGNVITKEWLEQVINTTISKRIQNIKIIPIRNNDNMAESIYVVKIPRSYDAPHMSKDNCYYKRFNFQSVKMEEFEVRDLFNRHNNPNLCVHGCMLEIIAKNQREAVYKFSSRICNKSNTAATLYKLNCYIKRSVRDYIIKFIDKGNVVELEDYRFKLSFMGQEPLFAYEGIDIARFYIKMPISLVDDFEENVNIEMKLFCENNVEESEISIKEMLYCKEY